MKTKTHFAFRVDVWDEAGVSIVDTGTEGASVKAISVNIQIVFTLERARA